MVCAISDCAMANWPQYTVVTTNTHTTSTKCQYNSTDRSPVLVSVLLCVYVVDVWVMTHHPRMRVIPMNT